MRILWLLILRCRGHIRALKADSGQGKPVRLDLQGRNFGNASVFLHVQVWQGLNCVALVSCFAKILWDFGLPQKLHYQTQMHRQWQNRPDERILIKTLSLFQGTYSACPNLLHHINTRALEHCPQSPEDSTARNPKSVFFSFSTLDGHQDFSYSPQPLRYGGLEDSEGEFWVSQN